MDISESLPLVFCLALHAGGVITAWLNRLPVGFWTLCGLRIALVAFAVAITGLALQSPADGFGLWAVSAMTLSLMVVAMIHDGDRERSDPLLARLLAAGE